MEENARQSLEWMVNGSGPLIKLWELLGLQKVNIEKEVVVNYYWEPAEEKESVGHPAMAVWQPSFQELLMCSSHSMPGPRS